MDDQSGLIDDTAQMNLIPTVAGHDILPVQGGFRILDVHQKRLRTPVFDDVGLAEDHAWAVNNFQVGRSMTIRDPSPAEASDDTMTDAPLPPVDDGLVLSPPVHGSLPLRADGQRDHPPLQRRL